MTQPLAIPEERLAAFCEKWRLRELSLFGSVLRDDFGPQSDVDLLIEFADDIPWSLFDWVAMEDELRDLFGREVDLTSKSGLHNPYRRNTILSSRRVVYAAGR